MSHMRTMLSAWLNTKTKSNGWSLRYVARKAGISHSTVARLANAEIKPTPESCQALARAFNLPVEEIMELGGLLPPSSGHPVQERRLVYEVNGEDLVIGLWRRLSAADQAIVRELMERLATAVEPRIIGEAGDG